MIDIDPPRRRRALRDLLLRRRAARLAAALLVRGGRYRRGWPWPARPARRHARLRRWTVKQLLTVVQARLVPEQARFAAGLHRSGARLPGARPGGLRRCSGSCLSGGHLRGGRAHFALPVDGGVVRPVRVAFVPRSRKLGGGRHARAAADHPGPDAARMVGQGAVPPARLDDAQGREVRPGGRGGAGAGRARQIAGSRSFWLSQAKKRQRKHRHHS